MPPSRNPFLIRTAEQSESYESDDQFMNLFGLAVLDILPEDGSWNRLLQIEFGARRREIDVVTAVYAAGSD